MNSFFKKHKNDFVLITVILIVALLGFLILRLTAKSGKMVNVIIDGRVKYTYSLDDEVKKVIKTGQKQNTLIVKDGYAFIENASCPDKICVSHRPVNKVGETVVCIPNKVVIEIE